MFKHMKLQQAENVFLTKDLENVSLIPVNSSVNDILRSITSWYSREVELSIRRLKDLVIEWTGIMWGQSRSFFEFLLLENIALF